MIHIMANSRQVSQAFAIVDFGGATVVSHGAALIVP